MQVLFNIMKIITQIFNCNLIFKLNFSGIRLFATLLIYNIYKGIGKVGRPSYDRSDSNVWIEFRFRGIDRLCVFLIFIHCAHTMPIKFAIIANIETIFFIKLFHIVKIRKLCLSISCVFKWFWKHILDYKQLLNLMIECIGDTTAMVVVRS